MLAVAESEQLPVAAARMGQPEAWNTLFQRYELPLYAYVFELVRSEATSLDIVQETFIAAVRHIGGLRNDDRFGSWLFGIAHQKCIQHWRQRDRELPTDDELLAELSDDMDNPRELLIREEEAAEFMQALAQLPAPSVRRCCCISSRIFRWKELRASPASASGRLNPGCITGRKPCGEF